MRFGFYGIGCSAAVVVFGILLLAAPASGAVITLSLDCVLNGLPGEHGCPTHAGDPFGSVTLEDLTNGDTGNVKLTVDLVGAGQKFKDLMLNFVPLGETYSGFSGGTLSADAFSIPPYAGDFDIFVGDGDDGFMTTFDAPESLSVDNFLTLDTLGNLYLALHIQSIGPGSCAGNDDGTTECEPGTLGEGSLKIGASLDPVPPEEIVVPEPATYLLLGSGLMALGTFRRRRTSAD